MPATMPRTGPPAFTKAFTVRATPAQLRAVRNGYPDPWTQYARAWLIFGAGRADLLTEPERLWCEVTLRKRAEEVGR